MGSWVRWGLHHSGSRGLPRFAKVLPAILLASMLWGCGGSGEQAPTAPTAVIRSTSLQSQTTPSGTVQMPLGATLDLDAAASVSSGGALTYAWSVAARPVGSVAAIRNDTQVRASFAPDVPGSYEVTLTTTDPLSGSSQAKLPLTVSNALPVVNVLTTIDASSITATSTMQPSQNLALGTTAIVDASRTVDPNGAAASLSYAIVLAPAGSSVTLGSLHGAARFVPDVAGTYHLRARATNASGWRADAILPFVVTPPTHTVAITTQLTANPSSMLVNAVVDNHVTIDGAGAWSPGSAYTAQWALTDKPTRSALTQPNAVSATAVSIVPDLVGRYTLQLSVVDPSTAAVVAVHQVHVDVAEAPVITTTATVTPVAAVSGPSYLAVVDTEVTLRATGSYDPAGGNLSYEWTLTSRPATSTVRVESDAPTVGFTPDVDGVYVITLTVSSPSGSASQSMAIQVGGLAPVAIVAETNLTLVQGQTVNVSAAGSYSPQGTALSFAWALDARPPDSSAAIGNPTSPTLNFMPDLPGSYYATVTVSDGALNSVTGVNILVLPP